MAGFALGAPASQIPRLYATLKVLNNTIVDAKINSQFTLLALPLLGAALPLVILFSSVAARAAVIGVSADEVISIEGVDDDFHTGDLYYAVDTEGIRRGIIELTSVSAPDAKAKLIKGEVLPGETLVLRPRQASTSHHFSETLPRKNVPAAADAPKLFAKEKHWHWGLGVDTFTLIGNFAGSSSVARQIGVAASINRSFRTSRHFTLDFGLMYYGAGASINQTGVSGGITLQYIGITSYANYAFFDDDDYQIRVKGGIMASGLITSKESVNTSIASTSQASIVNQRTDLSILGGLEYMTTPGGWWVDVLIDYGLVNIANAGSSSSVVNNQGFMLMAGGSF